MRKTVVIFIMAIIGILLLGKTVNAAEKASLSVKTSKSSVSVGDSVDVKLSIINNSVSDGISLVYGIMEFGTDTFEISTLDFDSEISKAGTLMKSILQALQQNGCKLAYVDTNWCIAIIEEPGAYAFTALTMVDEIGAGTSNHEIGTITFKVKSGAKNQNTKIDFTNTTVSSAASGATSGDTDASNLDDAITLEDTHTDIITIGGTSSSNDYEEIEDLGDDTEDDSNIGSETGKTNIGTLDSGSSSTSYSSKDSEISSTQADTDTPYTGVEDLIPVFIITAVIGFFGYIKYKKYQGI